MEQKIPTELWRAELLKLVREAPKAVCVEVEATTNGNGHSEPEIDGVLFNFNLNGNGGCGVNGGVLNSLDNQSTGGSSSGGGSIGKNGHLNIHDHAGDISDSLEFPYQKAFHGYLNQSETLSLLKKDGHYLVRKRETDDDFILSIRFRGHLKNFSVSFDDSTGLYYIGEKEKGYSSLQSLVQEGLVTLHLELEAGPYIDVMCNLTNFHMKERIRGKNGFNNNSGSNSKAELALPQSNKQHSGSHRNSPIPSPSVSNVSRSSMERERPSSNKRGSHNNLKCHAFQIHTFEGLSRCQICQNFLWGISSQGLRCKDCGFSVHENCSERVSFDCEPSLESIDKIFGADLSLICKACDGPPFLLVKCINEIEKRGLSIEGIYRVSGSKELSDRIRNLLEKERDVANLNVTDNNNSDIHSICGLVKLYLRLLPIPLITTDVFESLLNASGSLTLEVIKRNIRKLPPAHLVTLKYLLLHLHTVSEAADKNKMNSFNLSSVFTPSISPNLNLTTLKVGTDVLQKMISHYFYFFPAPQSTVIM